MLFYDMNKSRYLAKNVKLQLELRIKMNTQPKISIIVPVYNVEEYLVKCLDSLINQTLKDIEIICINDGSTDNSLDILKAYSKNDERIVLINKENEGVSIARNSGIEKASGEYIMFVDSDDYLELTACEDLYKKIKKDSSDLLIFNHFCIFENNKKNAKELNALTEDIIFNFKNSPEDFFYINTGILGKLYKNNNIGKLNTLLKKGEDTVFFWEYCLKNNPKISILNKSLYNYRIRSNSTMENIEHFKNCEIFQSIDVLINSKHFKQANPTTQILILDRWGLSLAYEYKVFVKYKNIKIPKVYKQKTKEFIKLFDKYDSNLTCKIRNRLKHQISKAKYGKYVKLANKLFYVTNVDRHKVINIAGVRLKFKYLKGQLKKEQNFIKKIKKNQNNFQKDCYLLFDCLHDNTVECIDAYSLFQYMETLGGKAYYVVLKDTELYRHLEAQNKLEHIIGLEKSVKDYPGDFFENIYDILLKTKAIITSFGENTITTNKFFKQNPYWQYIFIQHGPTFMKETVLYNNYLYPEKFDKILVSSENETNLFKKYNWDENKLLKAGLPRWDLLPKNYSKNSEKTILIMLTWRKLNLVSFENSLYKKNLLRLLNNKKLNTLLEEKNIKLYFAPHHALLTNQDINFTINSKNITILNSENISKYIKQCSCLITDFSSVAFDFMFQDKPVILYLLDKDEPNAHIHDREDMARFDYKKYIIPNVCYEEDEVIEKLKYYIENNFELEHETKEKYDKFFYTKENIRQKLVEEIDRICK